MQFKAEDDILPDPENVTDKKKKNEINYDVFLPLGVCFMGSGVCFMTTISHVLGFSLMTLGAVYMVIGWKKKKLKDK